MPFRPKAAMRPSPATLSRRQWTAALTKLSGAAALASVVPAAAQVTSKTPPQGAPAPAPVPATPEQKLQKAYADIREISERLAKIEVPMDVEPAFSFRP